MSIPNVEELLKGAEVYINIRSCFCSTSAGLTFCRRDSVGAIVRVLHMYLTQGMFVDKKGSSDAPVCGVWIVTALGGGVGREDDGMARVGELKD